MYLKRLLIIIIFQGSTEVCKPNLILVHGIFRHGDRTNDKIDIYPNDPHKNFTYFPFGFGALTNEGKRREHALGGILRKRYNEFLGYPYTPNLVNARSTDTNRTKMSLELVLDALFPDPSLNWEPIPYYYSPLQSDKVLYGLLACPNFLNYLGEHTNSEEVQEETNKYRKTLDYLSEYSGWNVTDLTFASILYYSLKAEDVWGLALPEWTKKVYPETLEEITAKQYRIQSGTVQLKQIVSGYLLQKIVEDTKSKINGTSGVEDTKLFLYSGHDVNVANFLNTLGVFEPHVPSYGSCILIEVHRNDDQYGVKIFYENDESLQRGFLILPDCEEFCPLDKFISLVEDYFPSGDVCGQGRIMDF